jgi:hypothetical protein
MKIRDKEQLLRAARGNLRQAEYILEIIEKSDKFVMFYANLTYQFLCLARLIEMDDDARKLDWKTGEYSDE